MADQKARDPGVTPLGKERISETPATPPDKGGPEWEGKTERKEVRPEVSPGRRGPNVGDGPPDKGRTEGGTTA